MTDRELLELAAKAYGLYTEPVNARDWIAPSSLPVDNYYANNGPTWGLQVVGGLWNPLEDDGDALRLAVKLEIDLSFYSERDARVYAQTKHLLGFGTDDRPAYQAHEYMKEPYGGDPFAATRRAIVRAAAEIGKAMP